MFKDELLATGILEDDPEGVSLGIDTTGVIRRAGANVSNVAVGDRIFALAPHGCITDRLVLPSSLAVKLPDDLSFEDAATMPCCFATAIQSLIIVGRMTEGQVGASLISVPLSPASGVVYNELWRLLIGFH